MDWMATRKKCRFGSQVYVRAIGSLTRVVGQKLCFSHPVSPKEHVIQPIAPPYSLAARKLRRNRKMPTITKTYDMLHHHTRLLKGPSCLSKKPS